MKSFFGITLMIVFRVHSIFGKMPSNNNLVGARLQIFSPWGPLSTALRIPSFAIFCNGFFCRLRGPALAVGGYRIGSPAGGIFQKTCNKICIAMKGCATLYWPSCGIYHISTPWWHHGLCSCLFSRTAKPFSRYKINTAWRHHRAETW